MRATRREEQEIRVHSLRGEPPGGRAAIARGGARESWRRLADDVGLARYWWSIGGDDVWGQMRAAPRTSVDGVERAVVGTRARRRPGASDGRSRERGFEPADVSGRRRCRRRSHESEGFASTREDAPLRWRRVPLRSSRSLLAMQGALDEGRELHADARVATFAMPACRECGRDGRWPPASIERRAGDGRSVESGVLHARDRRRSQTAERQRLSTRRLPLDLADALATCRVASTRRGAVCVIVASDDRRTTW